MNNICSFRNFVKMFLKFKKFKRNKNRELRQIVIGRYISYDDVACKICEFLKRTEFTNIRRTKKKIYVTTVIRSIELVLNRVT